VTDERGSDPATTIGATSPPPVLPDPDPSWRADPTLAARWRAFVHDRAPERRPPREAVAPYLLIRSYTPGDRGARPVWPPTVCWESPDLLLIDASYTGDFDPNRLVVSPRVGRSYRAFVRVWNLGLMPAAGVHVRMWIIAPGFFTGDTSEPYYEDHFIGGAWLAHLDDRQKPGSMAVVEMDAPWTVDGEEIGHQCLVASVTSIADPYSGQVLVNVDRHVAQRNLAVLGPDDPAQDLVTLFGQLTPRGATIELTHGGPAVDPVLHGVAGPGIPTDSGDHVPIVAPAIDQIRNGIDTGGSVHVLTAFERDGGIAVIARSDLLAQVAGEAGLIDPTPPIRAFAEPGGTRRLLEQLGPDRWAEVGLVTEDLQATFSDGVAQVMDFGDLQAKRIAQRFGGPPGAAHLLRFGVTTAQSGFGGGYSIVVRE
jgi:hypothetical protein